MRVNLTPALASPDQKGRARTRHAPSVHELLLARGWRLRSDGALSWGSVRRGAQIASGARAVTAGGGVQGMMWRRNGCDAEHREVLWMARELEAKAPPGCSAAHRVAVKRGPPSELSVCGRSRRPSYQRVAEKDACGVLVRPPGQVQPAQAISARWTARCPAGHNGHRDATVAPGRARATVPAMSRAARPRPRAGGPGRRRRTVRRRTAWQVSSWHTRLISVDAGDAET